jgi:hypothetical protein
MSNPRSRLSRSSPTRNFLADSSPGYWLGLDRGREGLLDPGVWRAILTILSCHEGESIRDPDGALYDELASGFPEIEWISPHDEAHNFFRDYQSAWTLVGVMVPTKETSGKVRITELGRNLVDGRLSLRAVWIQAMATHQEGADKPFSILAQAFLELWERALAFDEIYFGIELGWRPGHGFAADAIKAAFPFRKIERTPARRLQQILKLMTTHGVLKRENDRWKGRDKDLLNAIASGTSIITPPPHVRVSSSKFSGHGVPKKEAEVDLLSSEASTLPLPLRETVLRAIALRRGQPEFRRLLLGLYNERCAMSGCDAAAALEAAHILPIAEDGDHGACNGLLLRADLHTLFDLHYIGVNPKSWRISVSPLLGSTQYAAFDEGEVFIPMSVADRPSSTLLLDHLGKVSGAR